MMHLFKQRPVLAIALPVFVFIACVLVVQSSVFQQHLDRLSLYTLLDLVVSAPLLYYLAIRNTSVSKLTVLRVVLAGAFLAGFLLPKHLPQPLSAIKTASSFLAEATLIGFLLWRLYKVRKQTTTPDFLLRVRYILGELIGNKKMASLIASELAVFYYTFYTGKEGADEGRRITSYKRNGIRTVLITFLGLFMIETAGLHLLIGLWSKTVAWTMTGLGLYTCLQLFAHIRALRTRPILLSGTNLILRNGILGGDAVVPLQQIEKIEFITKPFTGAGVVKLAFIPGLEKPNTALYLKEQVELTKPFGIIRQGNVLLLSVDQQKEFLLQITA
jgi:hypothetical protein